MLFFSGSKDVKKLLERILRQRNFKNLRVLDFPAGSGETSRTLNELGSTVTAWDKFPEFFKVPNIKCIKADLQTPFPGKEESFDVAICQEGIEHVPNQLFLFQEFHRILNKSGRLIITTPNYSNFRSRLSYFIFEAETPRMMPPNEIESIWFSGEGSDVYYGHIFSTGIMRMRCLARLAGFRIQNIHPSRVNWTSVFIGLPLMPLIWLKMWSNYRRALRKNKHVPLPERKRVFKELIMCQLHPSVLFGGHLIVEFEKIQPIDNKAFSREKEILAT